MNRMFGTVSGQIAVSRRGLGVLGTLVSLGICACGAPDPTGPTDTPSPTGTTTSPSVPGSTPVAPNPVTPNPVTPNPVNPAPVTPGVTPTAVTPNPVTPTPVEPGPVTPGVTPTSVTPVVPNPVPTGPAPSTTTEPTTTEPVTPTGTCTITPTAEISSKISTVGIVTFTTDATVTSAKIEFKNMEGGDTFTAPVDLEAEGYRTLLLGMKPSSTYTYKVIVNDNCSSAEGSVTTGNVPPGTSIPRITQTGSGAYKGFYVVSVYGTGKSSVILDQDGDIVWYGGGVSGEGTSRSRMDWEGKYMYSVGANPFPGMGNIRRVSMDGLEDTTNLPGTEYRHHDFTAVPGGIMTFLAHQSAQQGTCSRIVELSPDGTAKEIVADIKTLYTPGGDCHPNSIHYQVEEDTYTLGDREADSYVKIKRNGELVWQLGGTGAKGASFQGAGTWNVNHGHHYFKKGDEVHFLVFNNETGLGGGGETGSNVYEFILDETAMTATKIWTQQVPGTAVMGEVQRLPNDNTLVGLTTANEFREYSPDGTIVNEFNIGTQIGYVDYRPTLYGVPTKANLDYKKFD